MSRFLRPFLRPLPIPRALALLAALAASAALAPAQPVGAPLAEDGTVPLWLVAGPFDQPTTGFGVPADADLIGEAGVDPAEGDTLPSAWAEGGTVHWRPLAPDASGFVDLHAALADVPPGEGPERVWWAKVGYAFTTLHSDTEQEVDLRIGSNSGLKVLLNGAVVHAVKGERNAVRDDDTVRLRLRPGANRLLVRVGQTHRNEGVQFFIPIEWGWGFYARLVRLDGSPLVAEAEVPLRGSAPEASLASTFLFRDGPEGLRQRFDLTLLHRAAEPAPGEARLRVGGETHTLALEGVPFGMSRHALWLPAVEEPVSGQLEVLLAEGPTLAQEVTLEPRPRYELHLMLTSHTDVGYTHPQPTVAEKHALLLDDVIARAEAEPDFRWTVETVWQLEQFVEHRSEEQVERLMGLVREGRVAVSPIYANPFTGWVSEEELLRSFTLGRAYGERYGFRSRAAVFNDEPGFSWMLPQALEETEVSFLVAGLNEVFNDYAFQRTLPKVFRWEGAGGSSVVTYLTEAYNEGQTYGLVKGVAGVHDRMRERLQRLERRGYPYELVLLNATFGDNGGVPEAELEGARAWNAAYAYPRFVVSTVDRFAEAFESRYTEGLPIVRGDWTSDWSVMHQGELARSVRQRWAQHHLPLAEAMAAAAWLSDGKAPLEGPVAEGYHELQQFSAHGSGLEYGYGSPSANVITMAYREGYVQSALLATEAALQRANRRLVQPLESFETQGVFVFNGLGAARDAPVAVEFPREAPHRYRVVDPATERELPSHHEGYILRFVVPDLPALGYRRLRLEPRGDAQVETSLALGASTIENGAFRLRLDPETGAVTSLVHKGTGRELVRQGAPLPFGVPVRSVFGDEAGLVPLAEGTVRIAAHDERPVRVRLEVERPGSVVSRVVYSLWEGIDRVEVEAVVDLEALAPVTATETYGLPFPLALDDPTAHLGLLGGFADPTRDLFEGVQRNAHALRQSLALSDAAGTVSWASADSRVVRLYASEGEPAPTPVAVLANHFPEAWNRNEENAGVWPLRFALTYREGAFDPAFTDLFGRDLAQPPLAYPTWLTAGETARSFLDLEGDPVHLMAFQASEGGLFVRLRNPDGERSARVRLSIPGRPLEAADRVTFLGSAPHPLPVEDGGVSVMLGAHALTTLRLRLTGASAAEALSHSAPSTP